MSRFARFAPLVLLSLVLVALVWRLASPPDSTIHSRLEGKPLPSFALAPAVTGKPGLTSANLARGRPHLLNVFASWCVPCVAEVKVLGRLRARGVEIDGVAIRDRPEAVARFLRENGDPYVRIGSDPQSVLQIGLGSSGVPESFIVDGRGVIRYQHIGPIEEADVPMILARLGVAK